MWALLATIFGVVLEQLARRLLLAGAILARVVGLAWSLASLFAIPVLAIEGGSGPHALKRSTQLVKQRWGEGISGNVVRQIFAVALYRYAADNDTSGPFTEDDLRSPFRGRRQD